jgi:outer membrane protein assembly factor BamB
VLRCARPPLRVWVWLAATVALAVVAGLLWRGSDAAATESTTSAPADVPTGTPAGAVSAAWTAAGDPLPDDVVEAGRVLVGSAHGVRALDVRTGEEAWHYIRSNARLCGLTATNGVAVAVFRTEDRCDEAVALNAGTGVRAWTRSVRFRSDARLDSTDRIVLATSPTGLVTLDPTGSNIRWRYAPPAGCRLVGTDVGSAGVAVLQRCSPSVVQLRLLDGFEGGAHWTRDLTVPEGSTLRLLGADALLGLLVDDEVQGLAAADGAVLQRLPVPAGEAERVQQRTAANVSMVRIGGTLTALDASSGAVRWTASAIGLPTSAAATTVLVPDAEGFTHRDVATGTEVGRSAVAGLPEGGIASAVGPSVVYRLPGRVLGLR